MERGVMVIYLGNNDEGWDKHFTKARLYTTELSPLGNIVIVDDIGNSTLIREVGEFGMLEPDTPSCDRSSSFRVLGKPEEN